MENEILKIIIVTAASIGIGVLAGHGAVYGFNRIPASWLCEYGEEPSAELLRRDTQRLRSVPWKYVFAPSFICLGIYLGMYNWQYGVPVFLACWLLLLIAVSDGKYGIIPDQLVLMLAIVGIGMVPFRAGWTSMLFGALAGAGIMLAVALIGKLLFRKPALGFGDVKLCAAAGILTGLQGIITAIVLASFAAAIVMGFRLARGKIKRTDTQPLGPYLAGAVMLQLVVLFRFF